MATSCGPPLLDDSESLNEWTPISQSGCIEFSGSDDLETCRICYEAAAIDNPLISPCACRGSVGFIHTSCMSDMMVRTRRSKCDLCLQEYQLRWRTKTLRRINWVPRDNLFSCCRNRHVVAVMISVFVFMIVIVIGTLIWNTATLHLYDVDHWGFSAIVLIPMYLTWQYIVIIYISRVLHCFENSVLTTIPKMDDSDVRIPVREQFSYGTFQ